MTSIFNKNEKNWKRKQKEGSTPRSKALVKAKGGYNYEEHMESVKKNRHKWDARRLDSAHNNAFNK
jgi:hypothetical protein